MKIFDKRPLCMILCILLGGFVFFTDCVLPFKITVLIIAGVALLLVQLLLKKKPYRLIASLSLIAFLLSSLVSFIYFDCYFNVYNQYNDRVEIVATVTDANNTEYGASVRLACESINGKRATHKLYAYIDKDCVQEVEENTRVQFSAILADFEDNGDYQERSYMRSMGFSAEAYEVKDFTLLDYTSRSFVDKITDYRIEICEYIIKNSGAEGGGLLAALLLGERDYLPFQSNLSFKRCGLSHILALSGLHLTIITFAISFVLSLMKIRKKPRKVIEIIFVILYSALTGMPISVVRAALMHIIASIIFLCAAKSDSTTTLSISVAIICCVMPYAIYDVSLWLSAFATLGVLVYSELYERKYSNDKPPLIKRMWLGIVGGIAVSLFAIGTTYLISTLSFGEISLIGAISTPISAFFITPFMYLGLIFIPLAFITPLGVLINLYGAFICQLIRIISSISGIYISAEDAVTISLIIIFTLAFLLFLVLDIKKKRYPLLILLVLFISSNISAVAMNFVNRSSDDSIYFCDESDEYFLFKSQKNTYFIDVSSCSVSDNYSAIKHIASERITEITSYICTTYSLNTYTAVTGLASSIYIKNIYLPYPETESEKAVCKSLEQELAGSYTELKTYTTSDVIDLGNYEAIFPYRSMLEDKCSFLIIDPSAYITCYASSGMLEDNTKNVASDMISKCNRLILGRHGESYSNFNFILKFGNLEEIIVSSNNLYIPNEMLNYYKDATIIKSSERMSIKR